MARKDEAKTSLTEELKNLETCLNEGNVNNLYFFFGAEKALKNEWKDKMISTLTSGNPEMNSCQILGDVYDPSSAICEVTTVPFCAEKRVVVFEGCDVFNKLELKDLFLDIPEETVVIVIQEGLLNVNKDDTQDSDDAKTKWKLKDIKDVNYAEINFDGEKTQLLSSKIKEWVELENIKINNATINYLTENCGTDTAQLRNEISKLCAFVKSDNRTEITTKDISEICTFKLEVEIFDLSNKIEEKKAALAVSKYKDLIAKGYKPVQLLTVLFNRLELVYRTKLALSDNDKAAKLKDVFGDKKGYYVDRTIDFANRIKLEDLVKILNSINENYIGTFNGTDDTETLIYDIIGKMK